MNFDEVVLTSKHSGAIDLFGGGLTFAAGNTVNWHTGKASGTSSFADKGDALERRIGTFVKFADFTGATWVEGTLTLTAATPIFATYTWQHLDRVYIASGTGATALVSYIIASKVSDSAITLATSPGVDAVDYAGTVGTQKKLGDQFIPYPSLDTGWLQWDISGLMTGTLNISDTTYTYAESTAVTIVPLYTITKATEFAAYTWAAGDRFYVSAGTGAIPGWYTVVARISDDAIQLDRSIGAAATTNISGRLYQANPLIFRLYRADPSGANPTNMLANPTTITIPDVSVPTATNTPFNLRVTLKPIAPEQGTTDATSYQVYLELSYALASSAATEEANMYTHKRVARGTTSILRDSVFYLTYQKSASSNAFDFLPRTLNISHKAPRIFG